MCNYCQKTKLKPYSRGDDFDNARNSYNSWVVQYLTYISINVPSINQFHSKKSEILSENKTLTKTLTLYCGRRPPARQSISRNYSTS